MALEKTEASKRTGRVVRLFSTWGPVLGTAVVYFVAARLALRMVSLHGYATAVWPAAGLSLASLLRFGRRVSLGILLGAFAINAGSSFGAVVPVSMARSLAIAAWIAVGCTAQGLAGAWLVRRFVQEPELLADEGDIWRFCILAGPLASIVSATWANVTLVGAGLAPLGAFPIGWATWWVGDTIGVLIFAPLALILARSEEPWRRRRLPIGASLLVSFALVTALFFRVSRWEQARLDLRLARRGEIVAHAIDIHVAGALKSIEAVGSLMSAQPGMGRRAFGVFIRHHMPSIEGIQALAWAVRVEGGERASLEDAAHRDGLTQFRIMEQSPQGDMVPAGIRPRYVVVDYVEPPSGNEALLGFDVASEPLRGEALERAAATGRTVVTAPLRFLSEDGIQGRGHPGIWAVSPVYDEAGAPGDEAALRGFGAGAFRARDLLAAALRRVDHQGLRIVIEDEAAPASGRLLYSEGPDGPVKWRTVLDVGGRRWSLGIGPAVHDFDFAATWAPWVVLVGGLCSVGLLGILLLVLLGRATRVELLAAERARLVEELRAAVTLRDDFMAIAAHELRTPLTSLILQIQLAGRLIRDGRSGNLEVRIEQASRQAARLGRLVDDLLNASRITAGRLTLTREPCDLAEITGEVIARHEADAGKEGCAIGLQATGKTDGLWDQARLEQVVTNLLTNAIKFGGGKPVELVVHGDENVATLTVRDQGPGVPAEAVQRIFGKFERAVSARSYGGLGLGLFIALEIVEAHGGSLAVESVPGEGATFTLRLPKGPVVVETAG